MEFRPFVDRKRRDQKPRVLLSCTTCREKKLKCDRGRPCSNCQKRDQAASCHYVQARPALSKPSLPDCKIGRDRRTPLEVRFQPASEPGGFVQPSHWRALMDDATRQLDRNGHRAVESKSGGNTAHLLLGLSHNVSIEELVASLPPRHVTDRLVSAFLESAEPSLMIIHVPTFQSQYRQFWQSSLTISPAWLSLLYGVLAAGFWIERFVDPSQASAELPKSLHALHQNCAVALSKSDITVPGCFKVEAALMCLGVEYLQYNDSKTGVSILLGIVSRLAIMMGYHQSGNLCRPPPLPFEAEMRSRAWLLLSVIDNVVASQSGLPRVLYPGLADTPRPRNLLDEDLHPTMSALPPSRSATETVSGVVFMIALDDLRSIANEITELVAKGTISRATTLRLSQQLGALRNGLPRSLRMPPPRHPDPASPHSGLLMQRTLEMVYQRSRCILHRQYLVSSRFDPELESFGWACLDAARCVLEQQCLLFEEALHCPRRRHSWFGTSNSVSDCLTAAMVICLAVINESSSPTLKTNKPFAGNTSTTELVRVLHQTYTNLSQTPRPPVEVTKAAEVLATMLRRMGHGVATCTSASCTPPAATGPSTSANNTGNVSDFGILDLPSLSPGLPASSSVWSAFDEMINAETDFEMFDWVFWDREMRQMNEPFLDNL
ncbi:uncharacterized protein DSM5745_07539 [Aspergillus mulundensis]|uniref:Zn(2)-C6 fungal-type domain-containing protein n=1 Tax=Aspergillus mulundensis TaxID=1810919 RepID=A0A3D8RE72_9EURO|nr:Uncharacterized protein DSM5745_07539 [Aspergillus mulundensis]RDW72367.1 Uncharacterized protein DSM5745_07539 [Aspergillus mulundensis]